MTDDPRVAHLNAVAAKVAADHRYDPHFAGYAERIEMETRLFLARYDAVQVLEDIGRGMTGAEHVSRLLGSGYTQVDNKGAEQGVTTPVSTEKLRAAAIGVMHYCAGTPEQDWSITKIAEILSYELK